MKWWTLTAALGLLYIVSCTVDDVAVSRRFPRAATARKERIWPHAVIPYAIAANFSGEHSNLFQKAMRHWENHTCVQFIPKERHHKHYILFTVDKCGCCSYVGRRGDGPQAISIGKNCDKFGIVVHELGHVVGFWHEHTRPDRDHFVDIFYNSIQPGQDYNFEKSKPNEVESLGEPYDFDSIMHYARDTFSRGLFHDTILPKPSSGHRSEIGQRVQLSEGDKRQTNKLYKCAECGSTLVAESGQLVVRSKAEVCVWRILAATGNTIFLNVSGAPLPSPSSSCENEQLNYLLVRDGYSPAAPVVEKICGGSPPRTIVSTSNRMVVEAKMATPPQVPPPVLASYHSVCGGPLTGEQGEIQSPGYPDAYPPNADCLWRIEVEQGWQVAISVEYFHLEQHKDCIYDRVVIWEGSGGDRLAPPPLATPLDTLCGQITQRHVITAESNTATVRFFSDNSVQKGGFWLKWQRELDECVRGGHRCEQRCVNTVGGYHCDCHIGYSLRPDGTTCESTCGGVLKASGETKSGIIRSPGHPLDNYPPSKHCVWEIEGEEGSEIFLVFSSLQVEGMRGECEYDYVRVDGGEKICGEWVASDPLVISTRSNRARVEFASDASVERAGFSARWTVDDDECARDNGGCEHVCHNTLGSHTCTCSAGYELAGDGRNCKEGGCVFEMNEPSGEISSPGFPGDYPKGTNCSWYLMTTPGHRIALTFSSFTTEEHQQCGYDAVAVYDGGDGGDAPMLGTFCGQQLPPQLMSTANELFVHFQSDQSVSKGGFHASYNSVCGGRLNADTSAGLIYSHAGYNENKYAKSVECWWRMSATHGRGVKLEFTQFQLEPESEGGCQYDYVEIYDGLDASADKLFGRYCADQSPPAIISTGASLLLILHTDDSEEERGFIAEYRESVRSRRRPAQIRPAPPSTGGNKDGERVLND